MTVLTRVRSLWRNLSQRSRLEEDLDLELQSYVQMLADRNLKAGLSEDEAWRSARLETGGIEPVKEQVRQARMGYLLETFWQDVRCGIRFLAKNAGVTWAAVLSLALGIGLNSAIFSAINAVLLRPLPYSEPDRLVEIAQTLKSYRNGTEPAGIAPANYLDWQSEAHSFEQMAVYDRINYHHVLSTGPGVAAVNGYHVSASFFPVLGVQAAVGRTFLPQEDRPDSDVVLLSDGLWRRMFGSDRNIVGTRVVIDGRPHSVIGVMPKDFNFYQPAAMMAEKPLIEIFLPYAFQNNPPANRQYFLNSAIARLKSGVSIEQARTELQGIASQLAKEHPMENKETGAWLGPFTLVSESSRTSLMIAWGAFGFILLLACANVSNLFLVRTDSRTHEMGVRLALGAGRARLVRQLLTESVVVGLAGGVAGLLLALLGSRLIGAILPNAQRISRLEDSTIDTRVLAFTVALSVCTGLLCGLLPAIRGSRVPLLAAISESARTVSVLARVRVGNLLVVLQVALSLALLIGAGLMVHSLWRLYRVQFGYEPDRLITMQIRLPIRAPYAVRLSAMKNSVPGTSSKVPYWALTPRAIQFPAEVASRLRAIPGVASAAVASGAPMIRSLNIRYGLEGREGPSPVENASMIGPVWYVTPDYFDSMKIKLLKGRSFDDRDSENAKRVVIVNEFLAKTCWPNRATPIGERLLLGNNGQPYEVVGVVNNVRAWPQQEEGPQMYASMSQNIENSYADRMMAFRLDFYIMVRTASDPGSVMIAACRALEETAGDVPVEHARLMHQVIGESFGPWRSTMLLLIFVAVLSLILASVGIYGMISYTAARRTNEIGIRVALGASRGDVVWLVMKSGLFCTFAGMGLGLWVARGLTKFIAGQLFGVTSMDPAALSSALITLLAVALVAGYLPAWRAARLDPSAALRYG